MAVRLWNGDAYPRARPERGEAFGAVSDDPFAEPPPFLPRINQHPFVITLGAVVNQQRTLVFGPFTGAAMIREFYYAYSTGASEDAHLGLRIAPTNFKDGVLEARGTTIPGRLVTFGRATGGTQLTPYDQGYEVDAPVGRAGLPHPNLRIPVLDSRFFVALTFTNPSASVAVKGLLIVWDGIPPDRIAEFL